MSEVVNNINKRFDQLAVRQAFTNPQSAGNEAFIKVSGDTAWAPSRDALIPCAPEFECRPVAKVTYTFE